MIQSALLPIHARHHLEVELVCDQARKAAVRQEWPRRTLRAHVIVILARVRNDLIDNEELCIWLGRCAEGTEDASAVGVAPVVQDEAEEVDRCVRDGLSGEEIVGWKDAFGQWKEREYVRRTLESDKARGDGFGVLFFPYL